MMEARWILQNPTGFLFDENLAVKISLTHREIPSIFCLNLSCDVSMAFYISNQRDLYSQKLISP